MTCGIYKLFTPHGHTYVGSSINIESRITTHMALLRGRNHTNSRLQGAFNQYEMDYSVLYVCDPELLESSEQFWVNRLNPSLNLTRNIGRSGGEHALKVKKLVFEHEKWLAKHFDVDFTPNMGRALEIRSPYGKAHDVRRWLSSKGEICERPAMIMRALVSETLKESLISCPFKVKPNRVLNVVAFVEPTPRLLRLLEKFGAREKAA